MGNEVTSMSWISEQIVRYEAQLLNFAYAVLGCRGLAEDVVQEAFVTFFERADKLDRREARFWLIKVCRNLALDVKRRQKRDASFAQSEFGDESDGVGGRGAREPSVIQRTSFESILRLLDQKHRDVVLLRFQLDMSYKEIAEITGLSQGNVGLIIHQAIGNLRREFEKEGLQ